MLVSRKVDDEGEPVLVLVAPSRDMDGIEVGAMFVQAGQPGGAYAVYDPGEPEVEVRVLMPVDAVELPRNGWYPGIFLEVDSEQGE